MLKKVKYMKCPHPELSCMDCPHRGKHAFIDGKCNNHSCGHCCMPYDTGMILIGIVMIKMVPYNLYQCVHCKTIKISKTKPRCPECDTHD